MTFSFCLFLVYGKVYDIGVSNNKILNALETQFNEKYYTAKDLEYANVPGTFLTPFEYLYIPNILMY